MVNCSVVCCYIIESLTNLNLSVGITVLPVMNIQYGILTPLPNPCEDGVSEGSTAVARLVLVMVCVTLINPLTVCCTSDIWE